MIILPAIDLLDGQCVRLKKGAYDSAERVAVSPVETAKSFAASGAGFIHIVDLNGAKDGRRVNDSTIRQILDAVDLPVEVGGGIRNLESIQDYLTCGVSRVIIGSAAVRDPEFLKRALDAYGEKIAVGIDFLDRKVKVSGWQEDGGEDYLVFAEKMASLGVKNIICTDISRDGMLGGIDDMLYKGLQSVYPYDITASGGIRDIDDIRRLTQTGIYGAICGKSLYAGTLDLEEAVMEGKKNVM